MSKEAKPKPTARVPENQPLTAQEEEVAAATQRLAALPVLPAPARLC